ncbi:cytochrome P450 71D11-like [Tripterygium wilfordii]|uniref:cytochrome P450 71D11-like n=1 Tax=Tripterygium wilfordii TaxID=458696 RepID=UPI0018F824E1|nr:cytochrome P450 71D11-like [Tripterygium wilfordii]
MPKKFDPERFVNSSIDYKGNNYEFIPFGAGRKICLGMSYLTLWLLLTFCYLTIIVLEKLFILKDRLKKVVDLWISSLSTSSRKSMVVQIFLPQRLPKVSNLATSAGTTTFQLKLKERSCYITKDIALAPYGDYRRQMRKICTTELLSQKRVQAMQTIIEEEVSEFIKSVSSKARSKINLSKMLICLTYGITSKDAIGKSGETHKAFVPLVREVSEVFGGFSLADMFPSIKLFHMISGMTTQVEKLHGEVDKILENIINEHKVTKATNDSSEEVADDFVDVLLNLQECGDFQFPLTSYNIKAVVLIALILSPIKYNLSSRTFSLLGLKHRPQLYNGLCQN